MHTNKLDDPRIINNFTSAEFKYFIKKLGKTTKWFQDIYNEVHKTNLKSTWFVMRCGNATVNSFYPQCVIEIEIPLLFLDYYGEKQFIFMREGFAKHIGIEFPPTEYLGVKDEVKEISRWFDVVGTEVYNGKVQYNMRKK